MLISSTHHSPRAQLSITSKHQAPEGAKLIYPLSRILFWHNQISKEAADPLRRSLTVPGRKRHGLDFAPGKVRLRSTSYIRPSELMRDHPTMTTAS